MRKEELLQPEKWDTNLIVNVPSAFLLFLLTQFAVLSPSLPFSLSPPKPSRGRYWRKREGRGGRGGGGWHPVGVKGRGKERNFICIRRNNVSYGIPARIRRRRQVRR